MSSHHGKKSGISEDIIFLNFAGRFSKKEFTPSFASSDAPLESIAIDSRGAPDDAKEGVNSFLEKRPAKFQNIISSDMPDFFPWWDDKE